MPKQVHISNMNTPTLSTISLMNSEYSSGIIDIPLWLEYNIFSELVSSLVGMLTCTHSAL